jgi:phosphoribosylanthranilate isomerase
MMSRTRIKICGLTREADVDAAVTAGADAIGFVFYEKSPRYVTPERAAELARRLPPFVVPVGLFVNAGDAHAASALAALPNMLIQFHGDESPADCSRVGRPFLRAARIAPGFDLLDFAQRYSDAQALLLDAHVDGYGGGGKVFDWSLIPRNVPSPVVLSGGLHAGNVLTAMQQVRPWAVDVSSGVEEATKGLKSAALIRQFCDAVREADARIADLQT